MKKIFYLLFFSALAIFIFPLPSYESLNFISGDDFGPTTTKNIIWNEPIIIKYIESYELEKEAEKCGELDETECLKSKVCQPRYGPGSCKRTVTGFYCSDDKVYKECEAKE